MVAWATTMGDHHASAAHAWTLCLWALRLGAAPWTRLSPWSRTEKVFSYAAAKFTCTRRSDIFYVFWNCNIKKFQCVKKKIIMYIFYIAISERRKKKTGKKKNKNYILLIELYKREEEGIPQRRGVCLFSKQPCEKHMNLQLHLKQKKWHLFPHKVHSRRYFVHEGMWIRGSCGNSNTPKPSLPWNPCIIALHKLFRNCRCAIGRVPIGNFFQHSRYIKYILTTDMSKRK
jgi:hypothetical protein